MYLVPEKCSLSARKCGKGLKSKLEGKFEDYVLHKSEKLVISFIFTPFFNVQVFFFFSL